MKLVREIEFESKEQKKCLPNYRSLSISDDDALRIFGPRVFDEYTKQWIDDDFQVIWARPITSSEAALLKPFIAEGSFEFDFEKVNYFFVASRE